MKVFNAAFIILCLLAVTQASPLMHDLSELAPFMNEKIVNPRRNIYGGYGHGLTAGGWYSTGNGGHGRSGIGGFGGLGYNPWPFGGFGSLFG
jgi:hypothetical protein